MQRNSHAALPIAHRSLIAWAFLFAIVVSQLSGALFAQTADQPSFSRDKDSYLPGETISFTGAHWTPGEAVSILVSSDKGFQSTLQATADDSGAFTATIAMPGALPDPDKPRPSANATSNYTAVAGGASSGATSQVTFFEGHASSDAERLIDEETFWNHRLTYPTGKYNPEWVRRAAEQDRRVKRGIPGGKRRKLGGGKNSTAAPTTAADSGSFQVATTDDGSGTTDPGTSDPGTTQDPTLAQTGDGTTGNGAQPHGVSPSGLTANAFVPLGPAAEHMTGCSGCFDYQWTEGRINDIVIDPTTTTNGSIVAYAASVGGGVWKTTNCCTASFDANGNVVGTKWTVMTDDPLIGTTSIDTLVIDPNDHNTIYAGTGDLNYGSFSMGSQGILKSTNGGASWTTLGANVFGPEYTEPPGNFPQYNAVGKVRVDPNNSNNVLAGTKLGLYVSNDAGNSWTQCSTNSFAGQRQDITGLDLSNMGGGITRVIAAVGVRGFATTVQYALGNNGANGIYSSTMPASGCPAFSSIASNANGFVNGAANMNAGSGAPYVNSTTGDQVGRIDIAIAPSNPNVIYAQVQSITANTNSGCGNANGCQLGVWVSTNGGSSWSILTRSQGPSLKDCTNAAGDYPQNWYDQGIAVDPNNADRAFINTYETFLGLRSGAALYDLTCGYNGSSASNHVVHVDHHAQVFVPGSSDILLIGNDGGVHGTLSASTAAITSVDATTGNPTGVRPTWFNLDGGLNTIEFYSGDISGNFATSAAPSAVAGAQDNGPSSVSFTGSPTGPASWQMGTGGDGFSGKIDPIGTGTSLRYWEGNNSGGLSRCISNCTAAGATWTSKRGAWTNDTQSFVLPIDLFHGGIAGGDDCPAAASSGGCGHLLAGTTRVWETVTGNAPSTVTWYITNSAGQANLTKGTLGNRSFINQVKYSPKKQSVAIVGTNDGAVQIGFNLGTGTAGQANWVNVTGGNAVLPNRPVMGIALDPSTTTAPIGYAAVGGFNDNTPSTPGHLFRVVCDTSCAHFTWTDKSGNLPNIPVDSVIVNPNFPSQVFAGSDFGLYYTDDVTANPPVWSKFTNLPNVMIWDMSVDRGATTLALWTRSRGAYAWALPTGPENPLPTAMSAAPASGVYNGTGTLSATLTSGGDPVSGKSVAFSLNGTNAGSAPTDATGVATLSAPLGSTIVAGTYPGGVVASFAGDTVYAAGTASNTLTVLNVNLVTTSKIVRLADNSYQATVTVTNNGSGTADNVQLLTGALGAASGSPMPQSGGSIAPGASWVTTVNFPATAGNHGSTVVQKYTGSYAQGTFSASMRTLLP